jgi:hypothetical protein
MTETSASHNMKTGTSGIKYVKNSSLSFRGVIIGVIKGTATALVVD